MLARFLLIDIGYEMGLRWGDRKGGMRREHSTRRYCVTVVLQDSVHSVHNSTVHSIHNVHSTHHGDATYSWYIIFKPPYHFITFSTCPYDNYLLNLSHFPVERVLNSLWQPFIVFGSLRKFVLVHTPDHLLQGQILDTPLQ
jgi:hypothetical protein